MQQEESPPQRGGKGQGATRSLLSLPFTTCSARLSARSVILCTFPFSYDRRLWVPGVCPAAGSRMWSHTSCAQHTAPQSQLSTLRARKPCRKARREGCLDFLPPTPPPPWLLATSRPGVSLLHFQGAASEEHLYARLPARLRHRLWLLHRVRLQTRRWCCKNGGDTTA